MTSLILTEFQEQCKLFATTYNPEQARLGNKVLRQRLRGPALASYYPRKLVTIKDVNKEFGPALATWDEVQEDRLTHLEGYGSTQSGFNASC